MEGNGTLAWTRLVAIRAQTLALGPVMDEVSVRLKDAKAKEREAEQTWSVLADGLLEETNLKPADLKESHSKMVAARRKLKRLRAASATIETELKGHQAEAKRMGRLFEEIFDEAASGDGLFDRERPRADQFRQVGVDDIIEENAAATLKANGVMTLGDFLEVLKKRKGVDGLNLAESSAKLACEAVAAALKASGSTDIPPVLRQFVPPDRPAPEAPADPAALPAEGEGEKPEVDADVAGRIGGKRKAK